ncbi:MAG: hypothetical protein PHO44_08730 [Sphaerochaetaceae bacterium]|nr:hypothetical protein [Sphaerochaetaceae bacterium]
MKNFAFRFTALLAVILMLAMPVFADDPDSITDTAGNVFASDDGFDSDVARDLFWGGESHSFSNQSIGSSMLLAGKDIDISECMVGGSIRAAGNTVRIGSTYVEDNISAAGQYVIVREGTVIAGAQLAGRYVSFDGEADSLLAAGAEVILGGLIHGDAQVFGQKVTVNPDCVVNGTLSIHSNNVKIASGAQIANIERSGIDDDDSFEIEAIHKVSVGTKILKTIWSVIGCAAVALLLTLVFPKAAGDTAALLAKRPWQVPLSGFIAILAILPAFLILLLLGGNGALAGSALVLLTVSIGFICIPVMGANIGLLVFPKWNPLLSALLGGGVLCLLSKIPVLGAIIVIGSLFCTMGYCIQAWYLARKKTN